MFYAVSAQPATLSAARPALPNGLPAAMTMPETFEYPRTAVQSEGSNFLLYFPF
jgi:hypothetical protein